MQYRYCRSRWVFGVCLIRSDPPICPALQVSVLVAFTWPCLTRMSQTCNSSVPLIHSHALRCAARSHIPEQITSRTRHQSPPIRAQSPNGQWGVCKHKHPDFSLTNSPTGPEYMRAKAIDHQAPSTAATVFSCCLTVLRLFTDEATNMGAGFWRSSVQTKRPSILKVHGRRSDTSYAVDSHARRIL